MTQYWVDVEDGAGTRIGEGPIVSATYWEQIRRMNQAGEFRMAMPAADPRSAYLVHRRVLRCSTVEDGSLVEIGAGVIERIAVRPQVDGPTLIEVAGGDLLRELAYRQVGELELFETLSETPTQVKEIGTDPVRDVDMTNTYDDNAGTSDSITLERPGDAPSHWLWVKAAHTFTSIVVTLGGSVNNNAATLTAQYYNEESAGWETVPNLVDGTDSGGATLAQTGTISFDNPAGWGVLDGTYQIRLYPSADLDAVAIVEVDVQYYTTTDEALAKTMVFAPAGWTLDAINGYSATINPVYLQMAGESVLQTLIRIAETTGENWVPGLASRTVLWLGEDQRDSLLRAMQTVAGMPGKTNADVVFLTDLERSAESYDLVTRIYPYGAGLGNMRITLAKTTKAAPAGYTLSTANNYIENDTTEATYGIIERLMAWSDITATDTSDTQMANAADTLFDRALAWLERNSEVRYQYRASVTKAARPLWPGTTLRVVYHEWVDGYHAVNIDADLWVLETTDRIDEAGRRTIGLQVATVDRWLEDDDAALASTQQQTSVLRDSNPPQIGLTTTEKGTPSFIAVDNGLITGIVRQAGVDGTYASPTSITVRGGIVTAVS